MLARPQARSPGAASRERMTETLPGAFSVLCGLCPLPQRPLLTVAAANAVGKQPGRREHLPGQVVAVDGRWQVKTTGNQGSGVPRSMSQANRFAVLPQDRAGVRAGDSVQVQLFDGV
jgi:molybdopterin molybdotransferase